MLHNFIKLYAFYKGLQYPYAKDDMIASLQMKKLKQLLVHAKDHVHFYKQKYEYLDIDRINSLRDLSQIPITSQIELRQTSSDMLINHSADKASLIKFKTSGTSNRPMDLYISKKENELRQLKALRSLIQLGWRPLWKSVTVWRSMEKHNHSFFQKLINKKRKFINLNDPTEQQVTEIKAFKPDLLYGITSSIAVIADCLIANNQTIRPKVLLTGGEVKTPVVGEKFLKAFGQRGYERYGAMECGVFGYPCPNTDLMYFDEDSYIIEVLDDEDQPVKTGTGRVVVTALDQYTSPIIRYDIGDKITLADEVTNTRINYKKAKSVDGRLINDMHFKNDQIIPFQRITSLVHHLQLVKQFQFLNDNSKNTVFRYVKKEGVTDVDVKKAVLQYFDIVEEKLIMFESCEHIPYEKSGKFSLVKKVTNIQEFH